MTLKNLDEFKRYDEFEQSLKNYASENFVNYYVSGSKSNEDPDIIWTYRTFKCVHAKNPDSHDSKSQGVRPNQKINARDCPWSIRCTFSKKKGNFIVKDFIDHHC